VTAPALRPCEPWPVLSCGDIEEDTDLDAITMAATELLWELSGHRYGFCTVTVRPCARGCLDGWMFQRTETGILAPPADYWSWSTGYPVAGCKCGVECGCTYLPQVFLPGPVAQLLEVRIDGESVAVSGPDAAVRVDAWNRLVRRDGAAFAGCQDFGADDGPGTLFVTYRRGKDVPVLGQIAMGELMPELARACRGQPCSLSPRARQVTRKGVQEVVNDPTALLDKGLTGLPRVDLFLTAKNPYRLRQRARVFDPMSRRGRRTGT
jgi:hypothetical protein